MKMKLRIFLSIAIVLICRVAIDAGNAYSDDEGQLFRISTFYGDYYQYHPNRYGADSRILVIVHGSLDKGKPAADLAEKFIKRWIDAAEKENLILIAPAFDRRNYQSYGGYRGLFGRDIGADEFVNLIVDQYHTLFSKGEVTFYLYGHSAGGQFAIRYCVRHPERVEKAVISAPGRYAFPDSTAPWPYGMGPLNRKIKYKNPSESKFVDIQPDPSGWEMAARTPITILVGSNDLEEQPPRPGHRGRTRIDLARNWANDMNRLAEENGEIGNVKVKIVDGAGHSSKRLTPYCINEFFR